MSKQALSKLRVIEIGHALSAPFTAQLLGDFGAEIIKVERPAGGDLFRTVAAPFPLDAKGNKLDSSGFLAANRNKKSITVDITKPAGQEVVRKLIQSADVVIENLKPGDLARYSLDYENVKKLNPGIVYLSISGFGQTGPYAKRGGLDGVFQYMSGLCSITGEPDGPPQRVGYLAADTTTGLYGAIGLLIALYHRDAGHDGKGKEGQYIDLAMLEAMLATMNTRVEGYLISGEVPMRAGARIGSGPSEPVQCSDGWLYVSAAMDSQFPNFCDAIDRQDLLEDPRFKTQQDRTANLVVLMDIINAVFRPRAMRDWYEYLNSKGVLCAPVYTIDQALDDPHSRARGIVTEVQHPTIGKLPLVHSPLRMSVTPARHDVPPPLLGQHTDSILREVLGMQDADIAALKEAKAI